ncbi:UdgX family uracil-DNA binding protein [Aeromicrobium sp.]|uniref:UdgX family uracil-DNA binding protein n=1 Tax=Aeromicrobium sp. TaxID=1871063 RepID=UPI0028AB9599|nr:UdgX family uracil-DNA binding protein [Aeromicrobium sp.]
MDRLAELSRDVDQCRRCELYRDATQAVFSVGDRGARLMLVGEQPGDQEDRDGTPFIGPAGRVLDEALERAGIAREDVYLTNAVKHFRFERRGKRRIHQKPAASHIEACHPWLEAEVEVVDPDTIVCLGATAGRSVLGRPVTIGRERGRVIEELAQRRVVVTTHPSALLRLRDHGDYDAELEHLVADLRLANTADDA